MDRIGDVIRKHRKSKKLTQEELGNQLFVSKQAVSKWENGRTLPDLETTQKLIEILEIDPNEILGGTVLEVQKNRKLLTVFIVVSSIASLFLCSLLGIHYFEKARIEFGYQDGIPWLRIASGSASNVVGLPMELLGKLLDEIERKDAP